MCLTTLEEAAPALHSRSDDTSFVKIKVETYELLGGVSIFTNYPLHFLKILRHMGVYENKENDNWSKFFLVEGWSILHKTKVLIVGTCK